jgi:replicative DNA helicase
MPKSHASSTSLGSSASKRSAVPDPVLSALRVPPHSIEAEQSVLGGLLLDNDAFDRISDLIAENDFYRNEHRRIYRQIARLLERGKPADAVTVAESLDLAGEGGETGGLAYLGELAANTPSAANIRRYAEIVRERAVLRQLVTAGDEIASSALNPLGREAKTLLDEAETKVFAIAEGGFRGQSSFQHIEPLLAQVIERIDQLHSNPSEITGVPTGFHDLDSKTSGLQEGDLLIVAGRPSMGKTAFALNIAEHVGIKIGLPVAIFSMEMGGAQVAMRMLSSVGRFDAHRLRTGRIHDDEWRRIAPAMEKLSQSQIYVDESSALNPIELRARTRRIHRQCGKLGLVIVDYLQLMSAASGASENRATEISEISRSLKGLARELSVPVVALSQLNRSLETRPNKRPVMSDLRESGAIEQDADVILFIYRDQVYNPDTPDKGKAEIIIGKQRNGPIGTISLTFLGEFTRFENFADTDAY